MEGLAFYHQCALSAFLLCLLQTHPAQSLASPVLQEEITPKDLMFRSIDYKNVLHWKPGKGIYNGKAVYFVQHKIYGEKQWTNATHCLGITKMSCDLSQETSDRREFYYARVQAALSGVHSPWVLSQRFVPQWETFFSPPKVKLAAKERSILVHLRPPHSPYRRRKGGWISMKKLHKFNYRIYVSHGNITMEKHVFQGSVSKVLIVNLRPRMTYCVQAEATIELYSRTSKRSRKICISL